MIFRASITSARIAGLNLMIELKHGDWNLTDLKDTPQNGLKVFSCFHCGGGSTMGYKLAGYDVLGGVEIDKKMMAMYVKNHNPKFSYLMGVKEFCEIPDDELPKELFELDILDGSPPCSSFSIAGNREKDWGKKKKFREGQTMQVLDDLFIDFIDIAKKLQPKVVVAENVRGLISGNARGYVKQIFKAFKDAGYSCQLFLMNAAMMGVPQRRERVFFIANRIGAKDIVLNFDEAPIFYSEIEQDKNTKFKSGISAGMLPYWQKCKTGAKFSTVHPKGHLFNSRKAHPDSPLCTLTSSGCSSYYHYSQERCISDIEIKRAQTFPMDYDFLSNKTGYVCGMSVPPFMMQRIAIEIERQIFQCQ
jgi:DNA (cytosine-5)-methyltransferase 1